MTFPAYLVCGKVVGETGNPCMRVAGHPAPCIDGHSAVPVIDPDILLNNDYRLTIWDIPRRILLSGIIICVLIAAQIAIDIYVLVR